MILEKAYGEKLPKGIKKNKPYIKTAGRRRNNEIA